MTIRETAALLREWDDILILTHERPDGDTLGCGAALCRILRGLGKTVWLLESKDATPLLRSYLEGCVAPGGFSPKRIVSVDVSDAKLLPPNAEIYRDRVDLAIDHHGSHTGFAAQSCVEADKAACGEIIYALAMELGVMDEKIAEALYVAVSTDTGCFRYVNTTPNTHRIAAALMEQGIDTGRLNKRHFRSKSMKYLRLESALVCAMELYQNGTIAVAPISQSMMTELGLTQGDIEEVSSFAGQVEGVLHSITIRELQPGKCRISLRTDPDLLNASAVCERFGGGGHAAAAGCNMTGSVRDVTDAMLSAIEAEQKG